jgi:hypothetical protein
MMIATQDASGSRMGKSAPPASAVSFASSATPPPFASEPFPGLNAAVGVSPAVPYPSGSASTLLPPNMTGPATSSGNQVILNSSTGSSRLAHINQVVAAPAFVSEF